MKKLVNLSCFLMLLTFQVSAENIETEPQFSIEVSNTEVLLGNYIEVKFTLKNAKGQKFEAPNFKNFDIIGGPNQSSSFSMMNGETTQSISYTYYLQPKTIGNFYLEPAFIEADGMTLETQPIEILVLENPDGIIEKPQQKSSPQMDMFNFPSDDFFNFPMDDFFQLREMPRLEMPKQDGEKKEKDKNGKKKSKTKGKVYKI
ncbi:MAG: BatD family protein [Saprospiraceae bacterium]